MSPAAAAALHAESDKLDRKPLSIKRRDLKCDAEAAQARPLAALEVGIGSVKEIAAKSTPVTSDNELIPSTGMNDIVPGLRKRVKLRNLTHTLLSSLVKGGESGVKSLKAWLENLSGDAQERKEIRGLIDGLSAQLADSNDNNLSSTARPHAGTSGAPTATVEDMLNRISAKRAISRVKSGDHSTTDMAPTSIVALSVTEKSQVLSTDGGDHSTAREDQGQRVPSLKKLGTPGTNRIGRRISTLRIRRFPSGQKNANPRYVQSSSKVFQQEAPKNTPSAGVKTQALAKYRTLTQTLVRPRAVRSTNKHEQTSSLEAKVRQKTPRADVKQIDAADLSITAVEVSQPPVPSLSYGLERVLFNPGVYHLQDPRSRVYNFDPYLQTIMPVSEFDFAALKQYITSSKDTSLIDIAEAHGKRYIGSSSSMTGVLAHFHFLLSQWREINITMMSQGFPDKLKSFTLIQRCPSAIFLRWKEGTYAIDADKEFNKSSVLSMLGRSMEKLLTLETKEFERYRRSSSDQVSQEERDARDSFHYSTMGDFLMRSQLDAYDSRLPGTGMFDLKTRAVVTVRMDTRKPEHGSGYEIKDRFGEWESYEREYYDMIRSAFLKYSLQVRMGRMDGIFVAFHNTERIFGFQYVSLAEMDFAIHGQYDTAIGDQEFKLSLDLLNKILDRATKEFPEQSIRLHFETREAVTPFMYIFAEPVTEEQVEDLQSRSNAQVEEFEREILGLVKAEDSAQTEEEENQWETIQAMVQKTMDNDELGVGELSNDTNLLSSEDAGPGHKDVHSGNAEYQSGHDEATPNPIIALEANGATLEYPETDRRNTAGDCALDDEMSKMERTEGAVDSEERATSIQDLEIAEDNKHLAQVDDPDRAPEDRTNVLRSESEQGSVADDQIQKSNVEDMSAPGVPQEVEFSVATLTQTETGAPDELDTDANMEQDNISTTISQIPNLSTSCTSTKENSTPSEGIPQALAPSTSVASPDPSEPQPPTAPPKPNVTADVSFLNEITVEHITASKKAHPTVLAMTLTIRNKVDNKYVKRPTNLVTPSNSTPDTPLTIEQRFSTSRDHSEPASKWSVEYTLVDVRDQGRAWTLYQACQARRKKKLDRAEEEDDGDQEGHWYMRKMRELAAEGKRYRKRMDRQDNGKEVVVLGKESRPQADVGAI